MTFIPGVTSAMRGRGLEGQVAEEQWQDEHERDDRTSPPAVLRVSRPSPTASSVPVTNTQAQAARGGRAVA